MSAAAPYLPKSHAARVYAGWANLAIAALAMVATLPGRTQGLGLITEPLLADLRMSRVDYATINLWATLIGSLFCLPCGRLVDRLGSRLVLMLVLLPLGATVIAMGSLQSFAWTAVAITLTRGFGQSALSVVSLAHTGKWFRRRLNQAMGLYSLLVGIGFIAAFPAVGAALTRFGWRASWAAIGWILLFGVAPVAWLVARDGPVDRGVEFAPESAATDDDGFTLMEALRSAAFWLFALSSSVFGLVYSGIALFNQSILEERGFTAADYYQVLIVSTMLGLVANFAGGWVASRWPIQRLMGIGMAVLAAALTALPRVATMTHVMMYAAAMGIAGGVVTVVFFSVWGRVYGSRHLGKIQGCAQMMTVLASAVGPLLLAWTHERTGSYASIFLGLAVVVAALGIGSWLVALPARPGQT